MKKRFLAIVPTAILATGLLLMSCATNNAGSGINLTAKDGSLITLRGMSIDTSDTVVTGDGMKVALETTNIDREFDDQPPLVSHEVDKYAITMKVNKCLDCHSKENYKKENTTRVPSSHYVDGSGKKLDDSISTRRYFCVQCHVAQVDAKPLIANTFQRAEDIR